MVSGTTSLLLVTGMAILLANTSRMDADISPTVERGDSIDTVVNKLGKPTGVISGKQRTTYYYPQGTIDFITGRVDRVLIISMDEVQERAAQQVVEDNRLRQQVESARNDLSERGAAALAQTLADNAFAARPASEQLEFWTQFSRQYPYTDVASLIARTSETLQKEEKKRVETEELATLKKRTEAIQERLIKLDVDYAASLTHWKRNEITSEKARLTNEFESIQARINELSK